MLAQLGAVLAERQRLRSAEVYDEGASERDPGWNPTAQDEVTGQAEAAHRRLREIAATLRRDAPEAFAAWVAARRAAMEERLAAPDLPA